MIEPNDAQITTLLRTLLEGATEHACVLLRPDGRIMWCNEGARRLFAVPQQDIVGQHFRVIFTQQDRATGIDELEMAIADARAISEDDRWHVRADGSQFWSSGALVPIVGERGELLAFGKILRDRTDLKEQIDLLANQTEALRNADRDKDRAITTLVHELRNVIGGLKGSVELLDAPFDDPARRARFMTLMHQQLETATRLTEDLLDVKRGQAHKIVLELENLELQSMLRAIATRFEKRLHDARLTLQLLAPPIPIVLRADRVRLQQIFDNLLDNAIKYTSPGGNIWVKLTTEDRHAVVHVEDTGRGIASDKLEEVFQLFTQVDSGASIGGLGIGLALVRELALLHRGSVQASSKGLGRGSEFSVRLPLADA